LDREIWRDSESPAYYHRSKAIVSQHSIALLDIISTIRHSLMGAQAAGELHRSRGGHYDVSGLQVLPHQR